MTPREKIHAAIDATAQEHGYTVEDILGKSRLKHLVAVRRLCILMLRERGYSTTEIGRLMDRCHSTIVHAINKPVDMCNDMVVRLPDQQRRETKMIDWTKDERTVALLPQIIRHVVECDEFSLEHEAQLNLIRDEYLRDLLNDYRGESADDFEDWHNQPTIEDFIEALLDAEPTP
jgi:hypothetical protein